MELVTPTHHHLPGYIDALQQGWSPDNLRPEVAREQLDAIAQDAELFLSSMTDIEAKGGPVILPDGTTVARLPGLRRWIWSDGFCGSIGLRWQPGTNDLPPDCAGHVGYAVVPRRRGRGFATAALQAILPEARMRGLTHVEVTTSPTNTASRRVIEKAGGVFVERYRTSNALGGDDALRFRIPLD